MKAKIIVAVSTLLMSSGLVLAAEQSQQHSAHHPDTAGARAEGAPAGRHEGDDESPADDAATHGHDAEPGRR